MGYHFTRRGDDDNAKEGIGDDVEGTPQGIAGDISDASSSESLYSDIKHAQVAFALLGRCTDWL